MTLNTVLQECLQEIFLDILFIISNDPYTQLSMIFANFFKTRFCYLISYLESHVANIALVFEKTTGVNFKKALMLAFNYYRKNAEKYILALKTPVFWQQILSNMLAILAFLLPILAFLKPNSGHEIEL